MQRQIKDVSFDELLSGAQMALENAKSLAAEASILYEAKFFSRSYALGHLAREELAKVSMLYRAAIHVLIGDQPDWRKLSKRFHGHKQKIINDQLHQMNSVTLDDLRASGVSIDDEGWKRLQELRMSEKGIAFTNERKNSALYVSWDGSKFVKPEDEFSERQAFRSLTLAQLSCADAEQWIESLEKWKQANRDEAKAFWSEVLAKNDPDE